MTAPVLEALEQRAGASDTDREAWLAERRNGITATEIRDLYLGKITIQRLVNRKLGREVDSFSGNKYTEWGKQREPVIAAIAAQRYNIHPESRVIRAADEPRFLASPDGVGTNFDEEVAIGEYKTGGMDLAPWLDAYVEKGYDVQQQWGMRVVGAFRSLYGWELRDIDPDGEFVPGPLQFVWIERNNALIAKLEALGDKFLAALDKAASEPAPEAVPIDEELDTHAVNYLRGLDLEKQAKALKEPAYRAMFERLDAGEPVLQESELARVSFTPEIVEVRPVFAVSKDDARAKAPAGLYERLEQAEDDVRQAQEALARDRLAVDAHEAEFVEQTGTERVVMKKATLRVTAAKETKGSSN